MQSSAPAQISATQGLELNLNTLNQSLASTSAAHSLRITETRFKVIPASWKLSGTTRLRLPAEPDLADCFSVPIMAVISKKHYHGMLLILVVSDNSRGIAQVLLPQGRCEEKPINRLKEQWSLILELLLAGPYCSLATVRTAFLTFLYFCPNRVCERV